MRKKRATLLSGILCVLLFALTDRSSSPAQAPGTPAEQQREVDRRQEESFRRMEEQQREMIQRQQEHERRMEEQRLKDVEEQKAIKKVGDEYTNEAWQDALGVTPEQWRAIKPQLETIRQLKALAEIDISIYWVAGSGGYQEESVAQTPDGTRSTVKASGQFSATKGVSTTSESSIRSSAEGGTRGGIGEYHDTSWGGGIRSGQFSATTGISTIPLGSGSSGVNTRTFNEGKSGQSRVGGVIRLYVQTPGPVKKQVGDINLGWLWQRPWLDKSPAGLNEYEKTSEQLLSVCDVDKPDPDQVRQQVEALRQVRRQRQAELQAARRQLHEMVTPEQEAKLILLGYLE